MTNPREAGYRMPPEWAPHAATWLAWPTHEDLWREHVAGARAAFAQLVGAVAEREIAEVLVVDGEGEARARAALPEHNVRFHRIPFGDIWLRDTTPIFVARRDGVASVRFRFNGWGGKYVLEHDDGVSKRVAARVRVPEFETPFVLEGGAVDVDGDGTALTTRQCLLNPNRNGSVHETDVEAVLHDALGVEHVVWLDRGLVNDHTDGHVDTLARFVRPGTVVAMEARAEDDPNRAALGAVLDALGSARDARGRRLEVVRVPSPGRIVGEDGALLPASYANFYVCNGAVVVPTYGSPYDDEAAARIAALFPGRRAVCVDSRSLLTGGGALHCITQQQPEGLA